MIEHTTATRQPAISPPPCAINPSTCNRILKNPTKARIIKTKNTPMHFQVIANEPLLAKAVHENQHLKNISNIDRHTNQNDRITSLGLAVIVCENSRANADAKIPTSITGEQSPRGRLIDMKPDPATSFKLGHELIRHLASNDHICNSTLYAIGLGVGHDIKQDNRDQTTTDHFVKLSTLLMNKEKKNEAQEVISISVRNLRKVFEQH